MVPNAPLVSVAIPLYRSKRFVRVIKHNVRRLRLPNVEILISDRHSEDDALDLLRQELGDDPRIRFLQTNDGIGWVDHYNALLQQASGRYFMWMPHDDTFPAGYVADLVHDLERHPEAWLSFGNMYAIHKEKKTKLLSYLPDNLNYNHKPWHPLHSVRLAATYNPGIAFRGVFRRDRVLAHNLLIRHSTPNDQYADLYWVFALGLHGKLFYNTRQLCVKLHYTNSTHYHWKSTNYYSRRSYRTVREYIQYAPLSATKKTAVYAALGGTYMLKKILKLFPLALKEPLKKWVGIKLFYRSTAKQERIGSSE
ncbi:hypothetical protein GCM10027275_34050 [Rhabdobacter roseus]|uniref:Glycosyltransferase involved in cell wall biosynthesis n=1 Tax=Rhabdobacter roseus TaxID=1655419 RepID=A0A840TVT5_9BACT|nr:glycosyltransferase family 2 protein [Rhabdobacter roseus]MBB5285373.1 glycosyltransferase involved in cell wall biosynthesis [Rhabdobacter roseus]